MSQIPIPSGPTHKEIIDRAFQVLGISNSMFGTTPEEYADALLALGAVAEEWPFDRVGFLIEDAAGLRVEEESGIARKHLTAVAYHLAEHMAPTFGKSLSAEARKVKNRAYSRLCSDVTITPEATLRDDTPRGQGNRYYRHPFFRGGR